MRGVFLLWLAQNTPGIPALLSHALAGAGMAAVFVAFRRALSAFLDLVHELLDRRRGRRSSAESDLPEPGLVIAGEWATLAVVAATVFYLATFWPWPGVLLGILAASAAPLFGFIVAPVLLLFYRRLEAAPDELVSWLREAGGDGGRLDVHVRVYDGELWNAYATGVVPSTRSSSRAASSWGGSAPSLSGPFSWASCRGCCCSGWSWRPIASPRGWSAPKRWRTRSVVWTS
jgi:hypothetical protein